MTPYFSNISSVMPPIQHEETSVLLNKKGEKPLTQGIEQIVDEMFVSTASVPPVPATPMKRKVSQIHASKVSQSDQSIAEEEGSPTKKLKTGISGRIEFGSAKVDIKDFSGVVTISSGNSSISINSRNEELPKPHFPTPNFNSSEKPKRPLPSFSLPDRPLNPGIIPQFPSTPSKFPQTPSKKLRPGCIPEFPSFASSPVPGTPNKRKSLTPKGQEKLCAIYEKLSLSPMSTPQQVINLKKDIKATNGALLISKDKPLEFIGQGDAAFVYRQENKVIKLPVLNLSDKLLQRNLIRTLNGYEQLKKLGISAAETLIVDDVIVAEYIEGSEPTFGQVAKYFDNMFVSPFAHFIADFKPQNLKFANQKVICIDPTTLKDHVSLSLEDFNSMVMELVMVFKAWQKRESGLDVRSYFKSENYEGVGKELYNETMERLFNPDPED